MFLYASFIMAAIQIHDLKSVSLNTSDAEVIELSTDLVYSISFDSPANLYELQYSPASDSELKVLNTNNKQRIIVIGNKLIISAKNSSKELNYTVTAFESGACQQYAYAFNFKENVTFDISCKSATTQVCIFPELTKQYVAYSSYTEGVDQFISYRSNTKMHELKNLDKNCSNDVSFSTAYFPYNTTNKTVSYKFAYTEPNTLSTKCDYYQVPIFDRSYSETTQKPVNLEILNLFCNETNHQPEPKGNKNLYYILGFGGGALLLIVLIIVITILIYHRRKRPSESTAATPLI